MSLQEKAPPVAETDALQALNRRVAGISRDFFLADAGAFAADLKDFGYDDYPGHPWFGDDRGGPDRRSGER